MELDLARVSQLKPEVGEAETLLSRLRLTEDCRNQFSKGLRIFSPEPAEVENSVRRRFIVVLWITWVSYYLLSQLLISKRAVVIGSSALW